MSQERRGMQPDQAKLLSRRVLLGAGAALGASLVTSRASASEQLVVVVHPDVPQDSFSKSELSAIFTTRKRNYSDGERIVPLNFSPRQIYRVNFDEMVLGMNPEEVARYWIDTRVRGGNSPPRHVPSAPLLVRLVEKLPGAIGYVPRSMSAGLKVVAEV